MADAEESEEAITQAGRWKCSSTATLYKRNSKVVPALLKFETWPIRKALTLHDEVKIDDFADLVLGGMIRLELKDRLPDKKKEPEEKISARAQKTLNLVETRDRSPRRVKDELSQERAFQWASNLRGAASSSTKDTGYDTADSGL